jgi:hypothetical protein
MKQSFSSLLLIASVMISCPFAFADDAIPGAKMDHASDHGTKKGMGMMEMTPEMRKKMAIEHQKMADCLNSTKPMSECHKEMMNECPMMKGMMNGGMNGQMKGHHMKGHMDKKGKTCAAGMMCSEKEDE